MDTTWFNTKLEPTQPRHGLSRLYLGSAELISTWVQADSAQHGSRSNGLCPGSSRLSSTWAWSGLGSTQLDLNRVDSAEPGFVSSWLDLGRTDSTWPRPRSTQLDLGLGQLRLTWVRVDLAQLGPRPTQNPTQNPFWIIQKCIQSISNPSPIKWIGLKIQKYWLKSNMDLDYELDLTIWTFSFKPRKKKINKLWKGGKSW